MKLVIAMINPDRLEAVQESLKRVDSPFSAATTASDLRDSTAEVYRGASHTKPRHKVRVEVVVVNDLLVEDTIQAIAAAAYSGCSNFYGKGNIVVLAVEESIPIRGREPRFEHAHAD